MKLLCAQVVKDILGQPIDVSKTDMPTSNTIKSRYLDYKKWYTEL